MVSDQVVIESTPNMQGSIVSPPPPPVRALGFEIDGVLPGRARMWGLVPLALAGLVLIVTIAAAFIPVSRWAFAPGGAAGVADRLSIPAVETYEPEGKILFLTVSTGQMNALGYFQATRDDNVDEETRLERFGIETRESRRLQAFSQMLQAKEFAPYVALTSLGYPTSIAPGEPIVDYVFCQTYDAANECTAFYPADEFFDPGDLIVAVNGTPVAVGNDIGDIMATVTPGEEVEVEVRRLDPEKLVRREESETAMVPTVASPDDPKRAIFGIRLADTGRIDLPFAVDVDTDRIGGPSAGLAFTLAMIDELTPGELTGGKTVAITGTIEQDGTVGAIGGVKYKALAAEYAGADVMLVPATQSAEDIAAVKAVMGDENVFVVATLDEALAALASVGGNGLELGQPGSDYTPS